MIKIISLSALLLAFLSACAPKTSYQTGDVPPTLVQWGRDNVVHLSSGQNRGSGFWVSDRYVVTACHVAKLSETLKLENWDRSVSHDVTKLSCDEKLDIAILRCDTCSKQRKSVAPILYDPLKQGMKVWGVGYPLDLDLVITEGHWQHKVKYKDGYLVTATTVSGDSGSPLIRMVKGRPYIVGIRLSIRREFLSFGDSSLITHIVVVGQGKSIQDEVNRITKPSGRINRAK